MKDAELVTVRKALQRGMLMVNLPVIVIMMGLIIPALFLWIEKDKPGWVVPVAMGLGVLLAWTYWSFTIMRWRLWAFTCVTDVKELERLAVKRQLIWPRGHLFERTEYRNTRQKEQWQKLQARFTEVLPKLPAAELPPRTELYYVLQQQTTIVVLAVFFVIAGAFNIISGNRVIQGTMTLAIAAFAGVSALKRLRNRKPQIVLNNEGVQTQGAALCLWKEITKADVALVDVGRHQDWYFVYSFSNKHEQVDISELDMEPRKLKRLVAAYREAATADSSKS